MTKSVILNNIPFDIPESGDQNYVEELTDYLVELSNVLGTISAPLDIIKTTFNLANNISSPTNVTGFLFATASTVKFEAEYTIVRSTAGTTMTESGKLIGMQGSSGWELARTDVLAQNGTFDSLAGITFDITAGGQVTYTSTDLSGQLSGILTFSAKTLEQ